MDFVVVDSWIVLAVLAVLAIAGAALVLVFRKIKKARD